MEKLNTYMVTAEEREKLNDAFKSIDFNDPVQRYAVAETLTNTIYDQVQEFSVVDLMCDVETYNLGQVMQFGVTKGVKAFVHVPGSYAPRSVVVKKTVTLYEEQTSVNLQLNLLELKSGRYGSLPELKRQMANELLGAKNAAVWNAFKAAIVTGGSNYKSEPASSSADTKAAKLNALISNIHDVGGMPKAIIGRYSTLDWITEITGYSEATKEQRDRYGLLGNYRGIPIVYLQQYQDGYGQLRIATGDMFIVSEGCGKLGVQLDNFVIEDINADTLDWNIHITEIWGAAVLYPERSARFNFS